MGLAHSPRIVTDGLVLALDAANAKSYSRTTGQKTYTSAGTYSWTCPAGVTSVSVVCVGGGGAGGARGTHVINGSSAQGGYGGGLGYKNNISVTPGQTYTVVVGGGGQPPANNISNDNGDPGGDSYFIDATIVKGGGGPGGLAGSNTSVGSHQTAAGYVGDGGGNGGLGGRGNQTNSSPSNPGGGGGGAGGYSGNGGAGGDAISSTGNAGAAGSGGSGGGGSSGGRSGFGHRIGGGGGGGVGLLGEGSSGSATSTPTVGSGSDGGKGGSGGSDAADNLWNSGDTYLSGSDGALYGGGGGGQGMAYGARPGAGGAVRIMWGSGRSYPSTNTADQFPSTWYDLIGGREATLTGSPTHTENYLSFDGSTQYASFSSSVEVSTAGFTMAFLMKVPSSQVNGVNWSFMLADRDSGAGDYEIGIYNINTTTFIFKENASSPPTITESLGTDWVYLVFGMNTSLVPFIYKNGVATDYGSNTFVSSTLDFTHLFSRDNGNNKFKCDCSCIHLYNRELTASEIKQNFNALRGRFGI